MARYTGPKEKIERRIGEKLFLKGERSFSPKAAIVKKPYPPGMHIARRPRKLTEYGTQLRSKQKVRNIYRLLERQFKKYVKSALHSRKDPYEGILSFLENRLDNVVYRAGFAQSRDQARQIVSHGHIVVNGRKTNIPSFHVSTGDTITIRPSSAKSPYFSALMPQWLKKYEVPAWISVDKDAPKATVTGKPGIVESGIQISDIQAIIEYYSR